MEFPILENSKHAFEEKLAEYAKKFKVDYTLEYGTEKRYIAKDSLDRKIYAIDAIVTSPEIDKFSNTGFTYLGSMRNEDGIDLIVPSRFAINNDYNLSDIADTLVTYPCHECNRRIKRNIVHVFLDDATGDITCYGSGCAEKKFGVNLKVLFSKFSLIYDAILAELDEGGVYTGGYYSAVPSCDDWLLIAYYSINEFGYVSRSKSADTGIESTSDHVNDIYDTLFVDLTKRDIYSQQVRKEVPAKLQSLDFDVDEFKKYAGEFVKGLRMSDFRYNMERVLEAIDKNIMPYKLSGYASFLMFKFWDSLHNKNVDIKWNTDYSNLSVKQRLRDMNVELIGTVTFDTLYGTCHIYTFRGEDGRKYKWKTGNHIEGDKMILTGTIKEFEDHPRYGKAVLLTRCIIG